MDSAALIKLLTGGGAAAASAMNPVTAGLAAIPEAYKLGLAIKEGIEAKKIREGLQRPTMVVPASVREGTDLSRMNVYDTRMPGQNIAIENLLRQQASGNQGIMSAGGGSAERMAAMVGLNQGSMDASNQLAQQAAQQQVQDVNSFMNQLNHQGAYEQQAWDWNQKEKFLSAAAAAKQLGDASNQNLYGGLKGMGGAIASAITTPELSKTAPVTPQITSRMPGDNTQLTTDRQILLPENQNTMASIQSQSFQPSTAANLVGASTYPQVEMASGGEYMISNPSEVPLVSQDSQQGMFVPSLTPNTQSQAPQAPATQSAQQPVVDNQTFMQGLFPSLYQGQGNTTQPPMAPPQVGSQQMAMALMSRLGPQIAAVVAQQPKAVQEQVAMGGPLPVSVMNPYNPAASYGQGVNAVSQPVQEPVFDSRIGSIARSIPGFGGLLKGL